MCGIFGYVGSRNAVEICCEGLKKLEYRGYDSAGIAGIQDGKIVACKELGKVAKLTEAVTDLEMNIAIAHTRWATHGKPSQTNAHPHFDDERTMATVHNGIIENHQALHKMLKGRGLSFYSETDTEVIPKLVSTYYEGDLLKAVGEAVTNLEGAYALAFVHVDHPGEIVVVANESPLVIGRGQGEAFIASDPNAITKHTREVVYLSHSEIAVVKADSIEIFDSSMVPVDKTVEVLDHEFHEVSKGAFEHYTLKEIFEQPQTLRNAMYSRFIEEHGTAILEGLNFDLNELLSIQRILILACGTSWHAGYVAEYMLEDMAHIPVQVEVSSEFRYKNPIVPPGTLAIAISQSGETADTLAAVRELKAKGAKILGICNVQGSSLTREADGCILLRAGPEIGVCSTKAFTSQLTVLALFTLQMGRVRHMGRQEGQDFIEALKQLPEQVEAVLKLEKKIHEVAKRYAHYDNFFFIGRRYMYPTCLEGALKLKEISYINANGYAAGELKHGPIALISDQCPTVAFCANRLTEDKIESNLMEIKARGGPVIAIVEEGMKGFEEIVDDLITVPATIDELAAIPSTVVSQLLAYYIALERGAEIDQPRNLAKSVTVE